MSRVFRCLLVTLAVAGAAPAQDPPVMTGTPAGQLLVGGSGHLMILSPAGEIVWEHKTGLVHDAWMLPNGNILYADGGVTEVTRDHQVVLSWTSQVAGGGGAYGCQRLANGNTMVAENSRSRIIEIDPQGKEVFALDVPPGKQGDHNNLRLARKLRNGNYLVCHKGSSYVGEWTPDGKKVRELKFDNNTFSAFETPKGTIIVSSLTKLTEFDADGKVLWEFRNSDIPGTRITYMCGAQLLPNGNLVVGCYAAYADGQGCGLFEITRDKQLVWRYAKPKADGSLMAVQLLSPDGKLLPGGDVR